MKLIKWLLCLYIISGVEYEFITSDIKSVYPNLPDDCIVVFEIKTKDDKIEVIEPEPESHIQKVIETFNLEWSF